MLGKCLLKDRYCSVLGIRDEKEESARVLLEMYLSDLNREDMYTFKYKLQDRMRKPCVAA